MTAIPNPALFGGSFPSYSFDGAIKNTGLAQIQSIQAYAQGLIDQADAAAINLTGLSFPSVSYEVNFDATGQLATLTLPAAPTIDDSELAVNTITPLEDRTPPTAPGVSFTTIVSPDNLPERTISNAPVVDPDDFIVNPITPVPERPQPIKPDLDYSNLDVVVDDSNLIQPTLLTLDDIDRTTLLPTVYRDVVAALANKLLSFFGQVTGLPVDWEEATWARARDRLTKEQLAQENAISNEFSSRGWDTISRLETSRIDDVRDRFIEAASGVTRDIAIKVFEEALVSLRLGMELSMRFYELWPSIYQADIGAQVEDQRNKTAQNDQLLRNLQAAIQIFDSTLRKENIRIDARLNVINSKNATYQTDAQTFSILTNRDVAVQQGEIEIEKTRIEAVSESYGAQSDIYEAEARALEALIRGDVGQLQGKIAIQQLRVNGNNETYRTRGQVYGNAVQGYAAQVQRDISRLNGDVQIEQTRLNAYNTGKQTEAAIFASLNSQYDSVSRRDVAEYEAFTQRQRIGADVEINNNLAALGERRADVTQAATNAQTAVDFYRQVAAAVWQSTNIGLSAGFTETTSHSKSLGSNESYNYSYSEGG